MGGIYALPAELVALIFDELDAQSFLRCKSVCRLFNSIDSVSLQYKVELWLAGMEDGPLGHRTVKERLSMLRAHQDAWNSMSWSFEETIPITQGRCWELNGGILAQSDGPSSIAFRQLPSALRCIESREWRIDGFDFVVVDFAIDPSYDLLVVVEITNCFKIHIRSLTTGEPHPLASVPLIQHDWIFAEQSFCTKVRNSSCLVGFMATALDDNKLLSFYNWRTGRCEMKRDGSFLECFAFVTDTLVMIACVYPPPRQSRLDIIDFEKGSNCPICSFLFPEERDWLGVEIDISGDLSSQWAPQPSLGVPFYTSHKAKLFAITYSSVQHVSFTLLLPLLIILFHLGVIQASETPDLVTVPWESWGPKGTRLVKLTRHTSPTWIRRAYGQRFVMGARPPFDIYSNEIPRVYDLNQQMLKRLATSSGEAGDKHNVHTVLSDKEATALDSDHFISSIATFFPCQFRDLDLKVKFHAIMMHEDGFIAVSQDGMHFHVFTF